MAVKLSDYRPFVFDTGALNNVGIVWEDACSIVNVPTVSGATYRVTVSAVFQYDVINRSAELQVIGTTPSPMFSIEAVDATDVKPFSYDFPYVSDGSPFSMTLQVRKEADVGILNVQAANVVLQRVL